MYTMLDLINELVHIVAVLPFKDVYLLLILANISLHSFVLIISFDYRYSIKLMLFLLAWIFFNLAVH